MLMVKIDLKFVKAWTVLTGDFFRFFFVYLRAHIKRLAIFFEQNKNILVHFLLMKRGRYNRPFLHISAMLVMAIGVLIAPFMADTYPIFSSKASSILEQDLSDVKKEQSIVVGENVFQTNISQKPRDKIITYTVEKGDTISTIAKKFDISIDTVKWANNLTSDDISIGDELKMLPVSGISHKVVKG